MNEQKLYSSLARFYDLMLWINGYKRAVHHILQSLPFYKNDTFRVLDAGCGTGLYSLAVLQNFPNAQVTAFDQNPDMLAVLRKHLRNSQNEAKVEIIQGNVLTDILEGKEHFDLIITGGLLEYVEPTRGVAVLCPYLKKPGYFLNALVKDNIWGRLTGTGMNFRAYSREQNQSAFFQHGFQLVKMVSLPHRYFPISLVKEAHLFQKG